MKRKSLVLAALALAAAPQLFAGGTWHKTVSAAQKVAREKNQLILVDMFADWCGWCHRFEREVFPSQVFQEATKDIVLLRLNTEDGAEGTQMSRKYGVSSLPTFVLLAPDLTMAGMLRGYAPPNDFVRELTGTRQRWTDFQKRVANEGKLANDPVQRLALAKEFMQHGSHDKAIDRLKKITKEKVPVAIRDDAYYHLALNYYLQNKYTEAQASIKELTALSKLGESVERARLLNGQIYLQQGNLLGAANEFRNFKKTFPNSQLIANVEMVLPEIERRLAASGK